MDIVTGILMVVVGLLAGYINTLAGAGSLLTLSFLMFFGMDAKVANGTNRIGILIQSLVATGNFKKQEIFAWHEGLWLGLPAIAGSIAGSLSAVSIDERTMKVSIGIFLALMLLIILFKPDIWLKKEATRKTHKKLRYIELPVYIAIGFYGGFIQAGVGYFLLAGLVLVSGYDLVKANALKVFIVLLFTVPALFIFIYNQQVMLFEGLLLAAGSSIGAWLGSHAAIKKGAGYIRFFIIATLLLSVTDMFFGIRRLITLVF